MELKLLHLSDIHFQHLGKNDHLDSDDDIRNELEIDLGKIVSANGAINAILISGDIAFSAKEEEYIKATNWLKKICGICNCGEENVFPVPGNHDLERGKIGNMLRTTHKSFKELKNRVKIDAELKKYLLNDSDFNSLQIPLENYYNFAQKFNAIPENNSLFWEKELAIENLRLRVRGMNSAIVSNDEDNEYTSKLILGSHQTTLKREKGVFYLTLCHHPPQWLYDGDESEADLVARARVQLYGHKHIFKITKINNSIKLSAGAVHPSRAENGWQPRYNILGISIFDKGNKKYLKVRIWERIWDDSHKKFKPNFTAAGSEFSEYVLKLDDQEGQPSLDKETNMEQCNTIDKSDVVEQVDFSKPNPLRKIAYSYFDLPFHTRIKIASTLNLIEDKDENLNAIQQSQKFLKKAIEDSKLEDLWEQVASINPELKTLANPFKK